MATKIIDSRVFSGTVVELRWSNSTVSAEHGRSYFLVVSGKVNYPRKGEVTDETTARAWANLHCRKLGLLRK
jgi:hypothetical protein